MAQKGHNKSRTRNSTPCHVSWSVCWAVSRSVGRSHFWIPSGFRLTAPAQPSATGLPCIRPRFYACFRPLISWLLSFVFIRYLRSQLLFRHGEFCLFEPSLGSFAERWVNRMLETHSGETSVLWGASQEAYTDRCLAFFFCSNDFLSMTTHFWFVSVIFHDSLRHKFVGIHG